MSLEWQCLGWGSAGGEDGVEEVGRDQLDQGELCVVLLPLARGSQKDLSMEGSPPDLCFRKIFAICIKGLKIHIFDPAIFSSEFFLRK